MSQAVTQNRTNGSKKSRGRFSGSMLNTAALALPLPSRRRGGWRSSCHLTNVQGRKTGREGKTVSVVAVPFYEETRAFPEVSPNRFPLRSNVSELTPGASHTCKGGGESVCVRLSSPMVGSSKGERYSERLGGSESTVLLAGDNESRVWDGEKWETAGEMG